MMEKEIRICSPTNILFLLLPLFCLFAQGGYTEPANEPGSGSCIVPALFTEWRAAKALYDVGKTQEAAQLISSALKKLLEEAHNSDECRYWGYYLNCGSQSIIEDYDRNKPAQLQKDEIEGIAFVRAMLGPSHRELINWLYDYQSIKRPTANLKSIRFEAETLLTREFDNLYQISISRLKANKSLAEIICPAKTEKDYFWRLTDILKNEGKVIEYLKLKEKQAALEDQLNLRKSSVLGCGGLWEEAADQYYAMALYKKAEPIYRMMLIRSCDVAYTSKSNISKLLPPPALKEILTFIDKGDYQYTRVMYLEKLKDLYIKQNRLAEAEQCVYGELMSMGTFYKPDSPVIESVKKELQEMQKRNGK